jgi:hypothetical protein
MLALRSIINNIQKGQSALKVKDILNKLDQTYQSIKDRIEIVGCKKEKTKVTIYLLCPSEKDPRIKYDIVLELHTEGRMTLDTNFKVYSNSPGFGYNYAYIFNRLGSLLWPEKYPSEFIRVAPKTRNPYFFVGFDKQIYSCMKYISDYTIGRIVSEIDGRTPPVKSFNEKVREVGDLLPENT